jgi:nicotinamide-nucleotide amidase
MAEAPAPALATALDDRARRVLEEACDRGLTLATAESCTGGLLASLLTEIPGLSHAFERGFVAGSDEAKHELLGVPTHVLDHDGAVSERTVRAMAEGALTRSRADVSIAITGFTETGAAADEPAGLVHFATTRRGQGTLHRILRFGDIGRAEVRLQAINIALQMLRDRMILAANAA